MLIYSELYPDQVKPVKRMKAKRVTAFNLFLEDCIKNTPDYQEKKSSLKSISKEVRQKWNELSDDEKVVWIEKAQTTANLQVKNIFDSYFFFCKIIQMI